MKTNNETQLLNLSSYLEGRKEYVAARDEFFCALQVQIQMRNSLRRPEISEMQFNRLTSARASTNEDEWRSHPARGIIILPSNKRKGRPFDFVIEQRGSLLITKIVSTDSNSLVSIQNQLNWFPDLTMSGFTDTRPTPNISTLTASLEADDLYTSIQSMERAIYLIDLLFETAVLHCSTEGSLEGAINA